MKHNWEYKQLGDICDKGSSNLMQKNLEIIDNGFEVFGASGSLGKIDFYQQEAPYVGIVKDGSGVGRCNLYPAKSSLLGTMQYIIAKNCVSNEYLCYLMQSLNLSKYVNGAAIPHIYFRDYKKEIVPVPPLKVQSQIVAELDKINETIEDCRELLRNLDALGQSLFYDYFGDPITNPYNFPKSKLDQLCNIVGRIGFRGYTRNDLVEAGQGAITLSPTNIVNGVVTYDKNTYISWDKYDESPEIMIFDGDVLLTKTGSTVGKIGIVKTLPEKATINPQLVVLKNLKLNNWYILLVR